MKAARIVGPRQFEIFETETPDPKENEVLVRVEHLSICGGDLHTYDAILPEENYPLRPGAPCHEVFGTIEKSSDPSLKPGQQVIALHYAGGLMEHLTLPAVRAIPVPEGMDPSLWVLCQPLGTILHGMERLGGVYGSLYGKRVVILGQGAIGLTFTKLVAMQGASKIITTDVLDYRLAVSKKAGADVTINARNTDVAEAVKEITNGDMGDVVIDACGTPETNNQTFDVLGQGGTALIFGMPHAGAVFPFNWGTMYRRVPNIVVANSNTAGAGIQSVKNAVEMVGRGNFDMSFLVTHRVPFSDVGRAYELFSTRSEDAIKVLISV
jgi:L-iditol 2-dehydrogenase